MISLISDPSSGMPSAAAAPAVDYIQPNLNHGLRIWWAFYWRNTLLQVLLAYMLGLWVKALDDRDLLTPGVRGPILKLGPFVLGYLSAIFVIRYVIRKRFRRFRIGLLSIQGEGLQQELLPTWSRTIRIWWTFMWRSAVALFIVSFLTSIPTGIVVGLVATWSPALGPILQAMVTTVWAGAASMYVIYASILDEDFSDFRVSLLPREVPRPALQPAEVAADITS